jgi:DNA-binding PadR family transcriptional regulator
MSRYIRDFEEERHAFVPGSCFGPEEFAERFAGSRGPRHGRRGPFGFGPPWGGRGGGPPFPFFRGPRARRGDVRAAILALLQEQPRNGYQIMQELEQRSGGAWRPSPGSVYPALQQLEDEGLVRVEEQAAGRVFALTPRGQAYVAEHRDEVTEPWKAVSSAAGADFLGMMKLVRQLAAAALQVSHAGTPEQVEEASKVLREARRALYRILAEDAPAEE